jgi:hypothetical protein
MAADMFGKYTDKLDVCTCLPLPAFFCKRDIHDIACAEDGSLTVAFALMHPNSEARGHVEDNADALRHGGDQTDAVSDVPRHEGDKLRMLLGSLLVLDPVRCMTVTW